MDKKYYNKNKPKKSNKEIPVCSECLLDPTDSNLKQTDFYWILKQNLEYSTMDYYFLCCVNCIEKEGYIIEKPYQKKRSRSKNTDKTN